MNRLIVIALCALLMSCASKPSPRVQSYLLDTQTYADQPVFQQDAPVIGVSQLDLAELLNSSGLVMQTSPHQVSHAGLHRWAEPLQAQLERQLYRALSHNLPNATILLEPRRTDMAEYELRTKIYSFQGRFDGYAVIEGEWVLLEKASGRVRDKVSFERQLKLRDDGYDELVGRLSQGWQSILDDMTSRLQDIELRQADDPA